MASTISYSISAPSTSDGRLPDSRVSVSTTERGKSSQLHVDNNIPLGFTEQESPPRSPPLPLKHGHASSAWSDGSSLRRVDSHQLPNAAGTTGVQKTPGSVGRVLSLEMATSFARDPVPMSTARKMPDLKLAKRPKSPHPSAIAHPRQFTAPVTSHSAGTYSRTREDGLAKSRGSVKQDSRRDITKSPSATRILSKASSKLNMRGNNALEASATGRGQQCDISTWKVHTIQKHRNDAVDHAVDHASKTSKNVLITSIISILPEVADRGDAANKSSSDRACWTAKISRKGRSANDSDGGAKLRFRVSMRDLRH